MKYLLDTCALLWALENNSKKLGEIEAILTEPKNYIAVSVVTHWEIVIKKSLGKLSSPNNLVETVVESGFVWINLENKHIEQLAKLPKLHTDPFDRLLIAQAQCDDYKLLTTDKNMLQYVEYLPINV